MLFIAWTQRFCVFRMTLSCSVNRNWKLSVDWFCRTGQCRWLRTRPIISVHERYCPVYAYIWLLHMTEWHNHSKRLIFSDDQVFLIACLKSAELSWFLQNKLLSLSLCINIYIYIYHIIGYRLTTSAVNCRPQFDATSFIWVELANITLLCEHEWPTI